mgnify:CR=1 FL=1
MLGWYRDYLTEVSAAVKETLILSLLWTVVYSNNGKLVNMRILIAKWLSANYGSYSLR